MIDVYINKTVGSGASNFGVYYNNVGNGTINNVRVSTNGGNNNYGIYLATSVFGINVTNNYVNTSGTYSNYGIFLQTIANENTVSNNKINTSGSSSENIGIYLYTQSDNNSITSNLINTGGSADGNYGVYISSTSRSNNITNNSINTSGTTSNYGLYASSDSYYNNFSYNMIKTKGSTLTTIDNYGIRILNSYLNTFNSNIINNSHGSALRIDTNYANDNNFTNNTIVSNTSWFDLDIGAGINRTWLIDQVIRNYTILKTGGLLYFKNSTAGLMGQIQFLENINGSGEMLYGNASAAIRILNNSVFVNKTIGVFGLNKSANVTLFGIRTDFANPIIYRDAGNCGESLGCYNFTSLNAGTVSFNVSDWGNYSVREDVTPVTNCSGNGCFVIRNTDQNNLSKFDNSGNLDLKDNIIESNIGSPDGSDFIIRTTAGSNVAWIDNTYGALRLAGTLSQNNNIECIPPARAFVIRNSSRSCVAYFNITGDLWLRGRLRQNATI